MEGAPAQNGLIDENGAYFFDANEVDSKDEVCINFCKYGTFNYSVLVAEVLPAAYLFSLVPQLELLKCRIHFADFMNQRAIDNRLELLEAVGINRKRLEYASSRLTRYRGIVICKINDRYKNHRISQLMPEVSARLKSAFADSSAPIGKHIYISRQNAPSRRITNYSSLTEAVLAKYGFVAVDLDNAGISEQINIFAKADIVLAEHGAGLVNAMFMRPSSTIIEIFPKPMFGRYMYRLIAHNFKLNYVVGCMNVADNWRWNADNLAADVAVYEQLVSRVCG
jgi:capsular polysaccharide biosynthesis protein